MHAGFDSTTIFVHSATLLTAHVSSFRILITGNNSGLVETITDAVSIHSIKKAEYARRLATGRLGHVTLFDHFKSVRNSTLVHFCLMFI